MTPQWWFALGGKESKQRLTSNKTPLGLGLYLRLSANSSLMQTFNLTISVQLVAR